MVDKYAKFADFGKAEKTATADAKASPPAKEGFFHRSADNKTWAKEYGSLVDFVLTTYTDEKKSATAAVLDLKIFSTLNKSLDDASRENTFSLGGGKATHWISADSEDDKADWIKFLNRAIIRSRLGPVTVSHLKLLARRRGNLSGGGGTGTGSGGGGGGGGGGGSVSFDDDPKRIASSPEGGSFRHSTTPGGGGAGGANGAATGSRTPIRRHIQSTEADDDTSSSDEEVKAAAALATQQARRTPQRGGTPGGAGGRRLPGTPGADEASREVAGAKLVRMNTTKKKALRPLHRPPSIEWSAGAFVIVFLCSIFPLLAWLFYRIRRHPTVKRWKSFYRLLTIVEDDKLSRIPQFKRVFLIGTTLHFFGAVYLYYRTLGKLDEWADFSNYSWIVSTVNCGLLASVIAVYTEGGSKGYEQSMDQQRAYLTSLKLSLASAEDVVNKRAEQTRINGGGAAGIGGSRSRSSTTSGGTSGGGGHHHSHRFGEIEAPAPPASTSAGVSGASTGSTESGGGNTTADEDGFPLHARGLCSQVQIMVNTKKRSLIKERMRIVLVLGIVRGLLGIVSAFVDAYLEDTQATTDAMSGGLSTPSAPIAAVASVASSLLPFQSGVGVIGTALSGAVASIYHATLGLVLSHPFLTPLWNAPSKVDVLFAIPLSTVVSILCDVVILFMLHFIQGIVLFSVSVLLESELHEDLMRWRMFDILASPHRALEAGLPYYIPLSVEFSAIGTPARAGGVGGSRGAVGSFEAHVAESFTPETPLQSRPLDFHHHMPAGGIDTTMRSLDTRGGTIIGSAIDEESKHYQRRESSAVHTPTPTSATSSGSRRGSVTPPFLPVHEVAEIIASTAVPTTAASPAGEKPATAPAVLSTATGAASHAVTSPTAVSPAPALTPPAAAAIINSLPPLNSIVPLAAAAAASNGTNSPAVSARASTPPSSVTNSAAATTAAAAAAAAAGATATTPSSSARSSPSFGPSRPLLGGVGGSTFGNSASNIGGSGAGPSVLGGSTAPFNRMDTFSRSNSGTVEMDTDDIVCRDTRNNIKAWMGVRAYYVEWKGRYDFARMQVIVFILVVFVLMSGITMNSWMICEVRLVIGFDTLVLLLIISDVVKIASRINRIRSNHLGLLSMLYFEQSLQLSNIPHIHDANRDRRVSHAHRIISDLNQQIFAASKCLEHNRHKESLRILGIPIDGLIQFLRGYAISYCIFFLKSASASSGTATSGGSSSGRSR